MTPERFVIQFAVGDRVADRLAVEARAAGRPLQLHAKLLFEAAYAARHGAVDDPALAEAVEARLGPAWNRRPSPRPAREVALAPAPPPTLETAVQTGGGRASEGQGAASDTCAACAPAGRAGGRHAGPQRCADPHHPRPAGGRTFAARNIPPDRSAGRDRS